MALMLQNSRCGLVASTSGRPAARPAVHSRMVRVKPFRAFSVQAVTATAPVKITIQGRRLQVTPAIQQYIEEKVTNAVKFYSGSIKKVDVTISARGGDTDTKGAKQQKVDVTIFTMRHGVVRVEDSEANLYASVDIVCDKVFRKLNKIKDKSLRKHKAGEAIKAEEEEYKEYVQNIVFETATASYDDEAALGLELQQPAAAAALPEGIVRSKVLTLSEPISVDQAIDQMEAVGHDFFIFRERASDALQVVYKRENGGYGILIPQKGQ